MSNAATKGKLFLDLSNEQIDSKTFNYFAKLIYDLAGISLVESPKNVALIDNRLRRVLRKYGVPSFAELVEYTKSSMTTELKEDLISALTTNKTEFFREIDHFKIITPMIIDALNKRPEAYIWSSACSIGPEPYSLAIHFKETLTSEQFKRVKILATDIDLEVLKKAADGFYTEAETFGLTPLQKTTHFEEMGGLYSINDELKQKVHFSRMNLFDSFSSIKRNFDLIMCRNVLIYFTPEDRLAICRKMIDKLHPGGTLILGMSEAGSVNLNPLVSLGNAAYRKPE